MKPCTILETLFAKCPDVMRREIYREHLETCTHCRDDEAAFEDFAAVLRETEAANRARVPTDERRNRLLRTVVLRRSASVGRPRTTIAWAAAASIVVAMGVVVLYLNRTDPTSRDGDVQKETVSITRIVAGVDIPEIADDEALEALATGADEQMRIRINRDALSVMEGTRLSVVDTRHSRTRIRLTHGSVHFSVTKRHRGNSFTVDAGEYRIHVVGTRFAASLWDESTLTVAVSEGVVEVIGGDAPPLRITAGEYMHFPNERRTDSEENDVADHALNGPTMDVPAFSDKEAEETAPGRSKRRGRRNSMATSGDPTEKSSGPAGAGKADGEPDMDKWRRMIVAGAYVQAENELYAHLAHRPKDWQAWSLLADCLRKEQKWSKSVASYQKLITLAPERAANRARLTASTVLQNRLGQHREAARLLEDYLRLSNEDTSLNAEIMVRLAKSYIALNQHPRAKTLLEKVVRRHRGNPIAKKAETLLHRIAPSSTIPH